MGLEVRFYDEPPSELRQKYAVIIAEYHGQLLYCRHRNRRTWEVPGGHIEPGETALEAAARELQEETGAVSFSLQPLCWYNTVQDNGHIGSLGLLCTAEVHALGELHSEIEEVQMCERMPDKLTYPLIQPLLLAEARRRAGRAK